jgi:adenylate kinase
MSESEKVRVVVLLAPPGGGKGTQAKKLVERFGLTHISVGDVLREEVRNETELGNQVKEVMEAGELVSDELVAEIIKGRLTGPTDSNGFVLDGYPRNVSQAGYLASITEEMQVRVINIAVAEDQVVKRLSGRRFCSKCGDIYNIYFSPSAVPAVCDECGGDLIQRSDDTEEVISERLRVYDSQTRPVLDYYKSEGSYYEVDGNWAPGEVHEEVARLIGTMPA